MKRYMLAWSSLAALLVAFPVLGTAKNHFILRAPAAAVDGICSRNSLKLVRPLDSHDHGLFLVKGPDWISPEQLEALVESEPDVEDFELVVAAIAPETPDELDLNQSTAAILEALANRTLVNYFGDTVWGGYVNQPATRLIRVQETHQDFATGAGVVAVIDTGVDPNHPALEQWLNSGYDFIRDVAGPASEWPDLDQSTAAILEQSTAAILEQSTAAILEGKSVVFVNQSTAAILEQSTAAILETNQLPPAFGHGTMIAGIIHLVAPEAKIMPLKVFKADGTANAFDIVRAIYYAVENGANVINMSFSMAEFSPEVMRAINYATRQGVICVASVGNNGESVLVYPAALGNVLGVAATTNVDLRSPFSNFGADLVSVTAPGEGIVTTYPGGNYAAAWGTSFSTALVSGAVALMLEIEIKTNYYQALDALSLSTQSLSPELGYGRIDLYDALLQRREALGLDTDDDD